MTLTISYFPPVEYFAVLARYSSVYMEACENYQKQSYRNRCHIYSPNGVQALSFPIKHTASGISIPIKEVEVDYSTPWVAKTLRSIDTAYRSSAYYDYYRDELYALMNSRPRTLWELDMQIIRFFMRKMGLNTTILETLSYTGEALDIHPKRPGGELLKELAVRPYYQVFEDKFGFRPSLSVMDLLFNEGPGAVDLIR